MRSFKDYYEAANQETWYKAKVIKALGGLKLGEIVALKAAENDQWIVLTADGKQRKFHSAFVGNVVQAEKDPTGNRITSSNPQVFFNSIASKPAPQVTWYKARVIAAFGRLKDNEDVAVARLSDGNWHAITANKQSDQLPGDAIDKVLISYKDKEGKPLSGRTPEEALSKKIEEEKVGGLKPKIISDKDITAEQKDIDEAFGKMFASQGMVPGTMLIEALAGTGKTTVLKHLAWKYGPKDAPWKPKGKSCHPSNPLGGCWLYLVFGKANKFEARESFPPWVYSTSTHGFCGDVLNSPKNKGRIDNTERAAKITENEPGARMYEKIRLVVDDKNFLQYMESLGIKNPDNVNLPTSGIASARSRYGYGIDQDMVNKSVLSILRKIRFTFRKLAIKATGLVKAYAIDPRDAANLEPKIKEVISKYDFDTGIEQAKDQVLGYRGEYREAVESKLERVLGYDFMEKDYTEELIKATYWLMQKTMPKAINQMLIHNGKKYNLGEYRDFDDDLWFAALHADQLIWPHYDVVLVDEVQDFNKAQMIILTHLHKAGARIIAVGDRNQAIFRFRGSDSDAMDNLAVQLKGCQATQGDPNWKPYTLTKNFRSKEAIINHVNANTNVKLIAGRRDAAGGVVTTDTNYDQSFDTIKQEKTNGKIMETAYIARTNDPLVHTALRLLRDGIPFIILGKDVAKEMLEHIESAMSMKGLKDYMDTQKLIDVMSGHLEKQKELHGDKAAKAAHLKELDETTQALITAIHEYNPQGKDNDPNAPPEPQQEKTIGGFKKWLKNKLEGLEPDDDRDLAKYKKEMEKDMPPVVLTTAHKSKGMEFKRVYILRHDLYPHPRSTRPEDLKQEDNLKMIALSRAREELHDLVLKGQPGVPEK